jgi:hypothetical protein
MTKLPTEEEYDNYHAGAPPAAQTTKPDAMTCAAGYQGGRDDDAANYHAGAPPSAQTTKTDAMTCAAGNQGGHDDDKAKYHVGAPPDAQTTKPSMDGAPEDTPRGVDDALRYDKKTAELIPLGSILCEQIKYDTSDFLGSCVRLYQDLTNTGNVPLKPAFAHFVDEAGDDYGLGADRGRTREARLRGCGENSPGACSKRLCWL